MIVGCQLWPVFANMVLLIMLMTAYSVGTGRGVSLASPVFEPNFPSQWCILARNSVPILWGTIQFHRDNKSVLLRKTTCDGQATNHYMNQWWLSSFMWCHTVGIFPDESWQTAISPPSPSFVLSRTSWSKYRLPTAWVGVAQMYTLRCRWTSLTGWHNKWQQYCFLQKEARVCVSNTFVIEDSKFKWCFCCGRWASDTGSRYANVNIVLIVIEWKAC